MQPLILSWDWDGTLESSRRQLSGSCPGDPLRRVLGRERKTRPPRSGASVSLEASGSDAGKSPLEGSSITGHLMTSFLLSGEAAEM